MPLHLPYQIDEPAGPVQGTLVCIPGLNSGAYMFTAAAAALPRWRVIRFATPGVDGVPLPLPFTAHSYAHHVQKHLGLLQLHTSPLVVLGHSLGGYAAQELALAWPNNVVRLILVSTSRGQPDTTQDLRRLEEKLGQSFWAFSKQIEHDPTTALRPMFGERFVVQEPATYAAFITDREANLPHKAASMAQLTAGGLFSSAKWLERLTMPTLVIHGTEDILVTYTSGHQLAAGLPAGRLLALHGVGHFPPLEHPHFWQYVADFAQGATLGEKVVIEPQSWLHKLRKVWERPG